MKSTLSEIRQSVKALVSQDPFVAWVAKEKPESGDFIVINNSFVFRDVATTKSDLYLCLIAGEKGKVRPDPRVVTGIRINSDFKRFSHRSRILPPTTDLEASVRKELRRAGHLLFLLIGRIHDNVVLTQPVAADAIGELVWDPSLGDRAQVAPPVLTVGQTHDEEAIWAAVKAHYDAQGADLQPTLRDSIGSALDSIQDQAVATLELPASGSVPRQGVTDAIVQVLREQRNQYQTSLREFARTRRPQAQNEILRIAYNFASDATQYIRLVVSICDLKPIVLWGTINEHVALSERFRLLPWLRSRNKPSLQNYELTISDARNSAFHNLFPFRKTLRVGLPDASLRRAELRIFSEHTRKKDNKLTYQDKELVDVLIEFTRARERLLPDRFWERNVEVMDATISLFSSTSNFLKTLHKDLAGLPKRAA